MNLKDNGNSKNGVVLKSLYLRLINTQYESGLIFSALRLITEWLQMNYFIFYHKYFPKSVTKEKIYVLRMNVYFIT